MAHESSNMPDWQAALNALPQDDCARRQKPGFYKWRRGRASPQVPLKLIFDGYLWHLLFNGQVSPGSGQIDPLDIPFVGRHAPFHGISEAVYNEYRAEFDRALPGSPLTRPYEPVDLRAARPLGKGH